MPTKAGGNRSVRRPRIPKAATGSKPHRVLIIDDDASLRRQLVDMMSEGGEFVVEEAASLAEAEIRLVGQPTEPHDAILLDSELPDGHGVDLCLGLRKTGNDRPIILMSESVKEADVIRGLNSGANDYVEKPFRLNELLNRLRAHLRLPSKLKGRRSTSKAAVLRQLDVVEKALVKLEPPSGGLGHNNPPNALGLGVVRQ